MVSGLIAGGLNKGYGGGGYGGGGGGLNKVWGGGWCLLWDCEGGVLFGLVMGLGLRRGWGFGLSKMDGVWEWWMESFGVVLGYCRWLQYM